MCYPRLFFLHHVGTVIVEYCVVVFLLLNAPGFECDTYSQQGSLPGSPLFIWSRIFQIAGCYAF